MPGEFQQVAELCWFWPLSRAALWLRRKPQHGVCGSQRQTAQWQVCINRDAMDLPDAQFPQQV